MSYVCGIKHYTMNKSEKFDDNLQELARFAKVISHPARLSILQYLAETKTCISGDISDYLPLSRTTVSQHLKELKALGLIHGEIDGLKVNYCLCNSVIERYAQMFDSFIEPIKSGNVDCNLVSHSTSKSEVDHITI
jgi:ArsR family transcriptional regulator